MSNTKETPILQENYFGHRLGGNSNALCDLAEFRFIKAMALHYRDKRGLVGLELYDPTRQTIIARGFKRTIYYKHSMMLLTGQLKNTLAIPSADKNKKIRIRTPFPNPTNFPIYNTREIDFGQPNHEVISWAFTHFAINYDYEELFSTLVPLVYADIFGEQLDSGIYVSKAGATTDLSLATSSDLLSDESEHQVDDLAV